MVKGSGSITGYKSAGRRHSLLLLTFAILMTCGAYLTIAIPDCLRNRAGCFEGGQYAPQRYRVLQPALEHLIAPDASQEQMLLVDFALQSVFTALAFVGLYLWLSQWGSDRALIGVLLLAVTMICAFHFYWRAIGTTIEVACVVWGLWVLQANTEG